MEAAQRAAENREEAVLFLGDFIGYPAAADPAAAFYEKIRRLRNAADRIRRERKKKRASRLAGALQAGFRKSSTGFHHGKVIA